MGVGARGSCEGDLAGELGAVSRLTEARREGVGLEGVLAPPPIILSRPPPPMILSMEKLDTLALGRGEGWPRGGAGDSCEGEGVGR